MAGGVIYSLISVKEKRKFIFASNLPFSEIEKHIKQKLKYGTHENRALQRSSDVFGVDSFILEVIDSATTNRVLLTLLAYHIRVNYTLNSHFGFNK